jgi:arginine/lysine/ornithine decarboxylase
MASIDGCTEVLREKKNEIFALWRRNIDEFRKKVGTLRNISLWKPKNAFGFDESKLVLMHPYLSGVRLTEILRTRFSIELEAAYPSYAIAMTGAGTKKESLDRLFDALSVLDGEEFCEKRQPAPVIYALPEMVCSVKDALSMPYQAVKIEDAAGRVSAEYAWAYPPGVPVIAPGERIGENEIALWKEYLASGVNTVTTRSDRGFLSVVQK